MRNMCLSNISAKSARLLYHRLGRFFRMVDSRPGMVTQILQAVEQGDPKAAEELLPIIYEELRKLARSLMAKTPPGNTLQPTALVHEAYLRLLGTEATGWNSRGHFFAAAARAMRRILVEQARRKAAARHGGSMKRVNADYVDLAIQEPSVDILALDEALERLSQQDRRAADVVMLRYFAGLTIEETAKVLGISDPTVARDWQFARLFLYDQLNPGVQGD
jgi:RNA polymerase sigma factor (TIGR02999 family)